MSREGAQAMAAAAAGAVRASCLLIGYPLGLFGLARASNAVRSFATRSPRSDAAVPSPALVPPAAANRGAAMVAGPASVPALAPMTPPVSAVTVAVATPVPAGGNPSAPVPTPPTTATRADPRPTADPPTSTTSTTEPANTTTTAPCRSGVIPLQPQRCRGSDG